MGAERSERLTWLHESDPDGEPIAIINRRGYLFTVRPDPVEPSKWRPDVDPRLVRAFVSFRPFDTKEEAMDFCERFEVP